MPLRELFLNAKKIFDAPCALWRALGADLETIQLMSVTVLGMLLLAHFGSYRCPGNPLQLHTCFMLGLHAGSKGRATLNR